MFKKHSRGLSLGFVCCLIGSLVGCETQYTVWNAIRKYDANRITRYKLAVDDNAQNTYEYTSSEKGEIIQLVAMLKKSSVVDFDGVGSHGGDQAYYLTAYEREKALERLTITQNFQQKGLVSTNEGYCLENDKLPPLLDSLLRIHKLTPTAQSGSQFR